MRTLMLLPLLWVLTACTGSTDAEPPVPPSLLAPCAAPHALPERALSRAEVEVFWGRDRTALRRCGEQIAALAAH